ncbi:MAG: polysaccharide biosynthesis/export protein [Blastocatellia bacterium]|jgi:protein involved in polysaccharide export with SLBB domain|nr:polysaccharide biosynthesis/export protein [Blastocatellia bacterium]
MKKVVSALSFALLIGAQVLAAQAQTNDVRAVTASTEKVAQPTPANATNPQTNPAGNLNGTPVTAAATPLLDAGANSATSDAPGKTLTTVPGASGPGVTAAQNTSAAAPVVKAPAPETVYRVGAGDVLDIRLLNSQTRESTLFTIMSGGLLEYPLAGEPLQVGGLTVEEINARLTTKIKIYDKPQLLVSVRDYVSHSVIIAGLVNEPGRRILRREAVPLYVVLAEAQPRPEAGRALVLRSGDQNMTVDLTDAKATAMLVFPGDVITLSAPPPAPPQFFYVGGPVVVPGQKDFHPGITLTQAVLAAGGVTRFAGSKVKISRLGADGRLVSTEHNLKQIESGKVPDPVLQPGDRLEVSRGGW